MPKPKFPEAPEAITRRSFLSWTALGWTGFVGALGTGLGGVNRFLFPNVTFEPPQRFKIGFAGDFDPDKVDTRFKKKYGVWVVRDSRSIYALSTVCTHLGCTPNWLEGEKKFKCPCHGSGFYMSGINFEGPAPRPLERYRIGIAEDGQIFVDKNQKFQQEKGQWEDSNSFLEA